MNRPFDDNEPLDPRLNRLAEGDVPADVQARAHTALAGLRGKMDRLETKKEPLIMKILFGNRWAKLGWAGSLAVIAFAVYLLIGPSKGAGLAFAEVATQLRAAQTMVYTAILEDKGAVVGQNNTFQVSFKEPGTKRVSFMGGANYLITDAITNKAISVDTVKRTYTDVVFKLPAQMRAESPIEKLRMLPNRVDQNLGASEIDGQDVHGYIVRGDDTDMTMWIDPKTGYPVRIEVVAATMPGSMMVLKDFKFNVPLPDSLFDMTPPSGFTRIQSNHNLPAENELLEFFREWTHADPDHEFPAIASTGSIMSPKLGPGFISTRVEKRSSNVQGDFKESEARLNTEKLVSAIKKMNVMTNFSILIQARGGEWHYAGKGVKVGDARPVCWWKEKDAKVWRVIYGDLKVGDVPQEDMTKLLESIKKIDRETSATAGK